MLCCDFSACWFGCISRCNAGPSLHSIREIVTTFHSSHCEMDSDLEETFFFAPAGKLISLKCADVRIICLWTQQICSQQAAPVSAREQSVTPDNV